MKTVLFCGGGTLGPVVPLLAVLRKMKKMNPDLSFEWAGTEEGPERALIQKEGIPFHTIPTAKFARYFTLDWLRWPARYLRARKAAKLLIEKIQPALVVSAGGFTAVPVMREANRRKIACAIHQLDAEPGLSNRIVAKCCQSVTTSFTYNESPFGSVKTEQVATPCRFQYEDLAEHVSDRPTVLVVGGGTGAQALNEAVWKILDELLKEANVIHATGKGKGSDIKKAGYDSMEFLNEENMLIAYSSADVVVTRAGMGGLSELASLKKAAIVVPIPRSHQEANAKKMPYPIVEQGEKFGERLHDAVHKLLSDTDKRLKLGESAHRTLPTDDGTALAEKWNQLLG